MNFLRLSSILLIAILLSAEGAVLAQPDDTAPVTFNDGVTVYYPKGWEVITDDDNFVVNLQNDETGLYVFLYSLSDLESSDLKPGDSLGVLEYYHSVNTTEASDPFDAAQIKTVTVGEREITTFEPLYVPDEGTPYRTLLGTMPLEEAGRMVTFGAYPLDGEVITTPAEEIFEIIASATTGTFYFQNAGSFAYPATWGSYVDEDAYLHLYSDDTNIRMGFYSPESLEEYGATAENLVPVLEDAFAFADNQALTFDAAAVSPLTAGDTQGVQYQFTDTYQGEAYERLFLVTMTPDGWANLLDLVPNGTQINADDRAAALDILASFEVPAE